MASKAQYTITLSTKHIEAMDKAAIAGAAKLAKVALDAVTIVGPRTIAVSSKAQHASMVKALFRTPVSVTLPNGGKLAGPLYGGEQAGIPHTKSLTHRVWAAVKLSGGRQVLTAWQASL